MAIPKYTARRKLDVVPAGAKAWPEMMSRDRRAMAGFGGTMMSVSFRWQAERDIFEISKIQAATEDFHFGLMQQLEEDWISGKFKDASQFEQAESDYEKARDKNIRNMLKGKRGLIADNVQRYTDNRKVGQAREFFSSLYRKEKEFRAVETEKSVEGAVQRGARDEAEKIISQGKHWLGLTKAKLMRDILDYQFAKAEIQKVNFLSPAEVQKPERLRAVADATGEQLLKIADLSKYKNLTPAQRDDLIRYADSLARRRAGIAKNMLDMIQENTDIEFFGEYSKGTLDPVDITEAVVNRRLDRAAGDRWLNALANPRDFPTNPAVEADLLRRIEDPTEVVTKTDVLNLMGKGLSVKDTRTFLADIDVFRDPYFVRADRYLKSNLGWSDETTKFLHPEGALSYHLSMNILFDAIETEKLKGRDILDRAAEISIPYLTDYWQNVLMLSPEQRERLGKMLGVGAEPGEPEPKRKVGRPKKVETRTETEKKLDDIWK